MRVVGLLLAVAAAVFPLALPLLVASCVSDAPTICVAPLGHAENLRLPAVAPAFVAPVAVVAEAAVGRAGSQEPRAVALEFPSPAIEACRLL